jgi:hypothetical protein
MHCPKVVSDLLMLTLSFIRAAFSLVPASLQRSLPARSTRLIKLTVLVVGAPGVSASCDIRSYSNWQMVWARELPEFMLVAAMLRASRPACTHAKPASRVIRSQV